MHASAAPCNVFEFSNGVKSSWKWPGCSLYLRKVYGGALPEYCAVQNVADRAVWAPPHLHEWHRKQAETVTMLLFSLLIAGPSTPVAASLYMVL